MKVPATVRLSEPARKSLEAAAAALQGVRSEGGLETAVTPAALVECALASLEAAAATHAPKIMMRLVRQKLRFSPPA